MRAHLSRWVCLDVESNLRRFREEAARAAAGGAELVVFPESFLTGYTRALDPACARGAFADVSAAHAATTFVFGTISEEGRNRLTVWRAGREVGRYDKVHLFAPNNETTLWSPGDRYAAVRVGGWTLGLVTCNDIRFPEQARALRLEAGCDVLVVPAWWPWRRDAVWATLLAARAIENGVWVLGCCVAASEEPSELFAGAGNHVFDPLGEPLRTTDDRTYELDRARCSRVIVDPAEHWRDVRRVEIFVA